MSRQLQLYEDKSSLGSRHYHVVLLSMPTATALHTPFLRKATNISEHCCNDCQKTASQTNATMDNIKMNDDFCSDARNM